MTERLIADSATTRLVNWVLGVGSVVTGGLLLWIGSTTFELAKQTAMQNERLAAMAAQQSNNIVAATQTERAVRDLALRVQRLEDAMRLETVRRRGDEP